MQHELMSLYAHMARVHWHLWVRYHRCADKSRSLRMLALARKEYTS